MESKEFPPLWSYAHFDAEGNSVVRYKRYVTGINSTYLVSDEGTLLVRIDKINGIIGRYSVQKPDYWTKCNRPHLLVDGEIKGYERYGYKVEVTSSEEKERAEVEGREVKREFITTRFLLHRAVALCWVRNDSFLNDQVDHIDNNRFNNRAKNLRWVTAAENHHYNKLKTNHYE